MTRLAKFLCAVAVSLAFSCSDDHYMPHDSSTEAGGGTNRPGGAGAGGRAGAGGTLASGGGGGSAGSGGTLAPGGGGGGGGGEAGSGGNDGAAGAGGGSDGGDAGSGGSTTVPDWTPINGPPGVWANSLFATDAGTLLVRYSASLLRSTDGGFTWSRQAGRHPPIESATYADGTIFTTENPSRDLYASTDEGRTWSLRLPGFGGTAPIAGPDGALWSVRMFDRYLRTSSDGGFTWTDVARTPEDAWQLRFVGGRLYLTIASSLYFSDDGLTWTRRTSPPGVNSIAVHQGSLFVSRATGAVLRSDDDGLTWVPDDPSPVSDGLKCPLEQIRGNVLAMNANGSYIRDPSGWKHVDDPRRRCPHARGAGTVWTYELQTGFFGRWDLASSRWVEVQPKSPLASISPIWGNDQVVFVTARGSRSYRSVDGGETWARSSTDNLDDVSWLGGAAWLADAGPDAVLSTDDGASWQPIGPAMRHFGLFVIGNDFFRGQGDVLLRSQDQGRTWTTRATFPLPPFTTALLYGEGTTLFVCGVRQTWRSTDRGATFQLIDDGGFSIGQILRHGDRLVALGAEIVGEEYGDLDVWHSLDDGATWQRQHAVLPARDSFAWISVDDALYARVLGNGINDPANVDYVWRSTDMGRTWAPLGSRLPSRPNYLHAAGGRLLATTEETSVWTHPLP